MPCSTSSLRIDRPIPPHFPVASSAATVGGDAPPSGERGDSVAVRHHDSALAGLDDDEALAVEHELERLT